MDIVYYNYYVIVRLTLGRGRLGIEYLDYVPRQHVHLQSLARNAYEKVKSLKWDFVEYKVVLHPFRHNKIYPVYCTRDCILIALTITDSFQLLSILNARQSSNSSTHASNSTHSMDI